MTSIERAMEKIGQGDSGPELVDDDTPVTTNEAAPNPLPSEASAPPPAATPLPEVVPAPVNPPISPAVVEAAAPLPTDLETEQVSSGAVPSAAVGAAASNVGASSPSRSNAPMPASHNSANTVLLQEDRLLAGGYLTANSGRTRQQEEYQQIKRRLLGNMVPGVLATPNPPNLVMVTSSVPGEGKTFTSSNLAISIAMEIDHTVLAVDTDIIKSDMSGTFGLRGRPGLFNILEDPNLNIEDVLVRTSIPNLVVMPAGTHSDSSTEHLASSYMKQLLSEIATRYPNRVVLFDSPPILATTTAAELARHVGQLVLVVESGKTKQETLSDALQRIEGIPVTGLVLNKSKQSAGTGYGYYGYYGAYRPEEGGGSGA